jgi:DGQHR domain-containing protein
VSNIDNQIDEVEEVASDTTELGDTISYTASLVRQGPYRFFTLTMPADVLVTTCTVDKRIENPIIGFQRRLDIQRGKEIARYIDEGLGTIPGSIILSAQPEADFKYVPAKRTISFKRNPRAFLILDGQHRVYGFHLAKNKRLRVPVVIYNGLQKAEEVRLFMDINTKQRPVPNELLLDIKKLAESESDEEAILREVYDLFNQETDSPLFGKMSPSEKAHGKLSRVTFNAALKAVYSSFGDSDATRIYDVVRSYLHAWLSGLRLVHATEAMTNPTGFRAIMFVFPFIAGRVADRFGRQYSVDNFNEVIRPLFSKIKKADFGRQGQSHLDLSAIFRRHLESGFSISGARTI